MPEHFKDETGLTRRTIMRTAAWSVPVIAAAVATPMAAASEFAIQASISVSNFGLYSLDLYYTNFDAVRPTQGSLVWDPTDGQGTTSSFIPVSPGNYIQLRGFTTGVTYSFTVTLTGGTQPVSVSLQHTF